MRMEDLKNFTRQEIKEICAALGFEKYRGDQVFEGMYKGAENIDGIKGLPEKHRLALKEKYFISRLKTADMTVSKIELHGKIPF